MSEETKVDRQFPHLRTYEFTRIYTGPKHFWAVRPNTASSDIESLEREEKEACVRAPCGNEVTLDKTTYLALRDVLDKFFGV